MVSELADPELGGLRYTLGTTPSLEVSGVHCLVSVARGVVARMKGKGRQEEEEEEEEEMNSDERT